MLDIIARKRLVSSVLLFFCRDPSLPREDGVWNVFGRFLEGRERGLQEYLAHKKQPLP